MAGQKSAVSGRRWPMRVLAGASLLATGGLVWLVVTASGDLPEWAQTGLASPLSVKCLAFMVAGVLALAILGLALLNRRGRPAAPVGALHGDQSGSAAIEMTLVMPFAVMIFLIVIQSAILFNANMVVHYAAFSGRAWPRWLCRWRSAMRGTIASGRRISSRRPNWSGSGRPWSWR